MDDETYAKVETLAEVLAVAIGSQVFQPLHDTEEHMRIRDAYRELALEAFTEASKVES